ncbi:hypothetical protein H9Q10_05290 [Eikenella sp. S3360]|uniref:DUF2947 family protein n=1 Tax=Eikenella glucosivorans TaxID=2766967 RepID=A0ABS0N9W9_9NEIS|nr:hypothetical protein [Eikenella glucosivorans]MBH5329081.1 hypothetical protein [Eikenella glucosivorans]
MIITNNFLSLYREQDGHELKGYLKFDEATLEHDFNTAALTQKGWIYAAIDDSMLEDGEIQEITELIEIKHLFCLDLDQLFKPNNAFDFPVHTFRNCQEDWEEILSPSQEYTLWNSLLFDGSQLMIIKPWSAGYNLLIAGKEQTLRQICRSSNWLFNQKYPIFPL